MFGEAGFGGFDEAQDFATFFQIRRAGRREAHAASTACQQHRTQMRFERSDLAGDNRARHIHLLRDRGKAAEFGDAYKELHAFESVHGASVYCCITGNNVL